MKREENESTNEIVFLGTSGQFIDDIRRSTTIDDSIELMKLNLESGHLGPTCPGIFFANCLYYQQFAYFDFHYLGFGGF